MAPCYGCAVPAPASAAVLVRSSASCHSGRTRAACRSAAGPAASAIIGCRGRAAARRVAAVGPPQRGTARSDSTCRTRCGPAGLAGAIAAELARSARQQRPWIRRPRGVRAAGIHRTGYPAAGRAHRLPARGPGSALRLFRPVRRGAGASASLGGAPARARAGPDGSSGWCTGQPLRPGVATLSSATVSARAIRPRRTTLAVPGSSQRFLAKARRACGRTRCSSTWRTPSRRRAKAAARHLRWSDALRDGDWGGQDQGRPGQRRRAPAGPTGTWSTSSSRPARSLDVIVLPKVTGPRDIALAGPAARPGRAVGGAAPGRIGIEAQIEDAARPGRRGRHRGRLAPGWRRWSSGLPTSWPAWACAR